MNHRRIILVIKNEDAIEEITQLCLETVAGWEVLTTNSVNEAIVKATAQQADAILLDLNEMVSYVVSHLSFSKRRFSRR